MPPSGSPAKAANHHSMRRAVPTPPTPPQRSEFEDFMNAYRPMLDVPRSEPQHKPPEDTSKVDFGRSIKKLMKRPQSSPRNHRKEGGVQRTPAPERERSVASDGRPATSSTSSEKKPKRPLSAHIEGGLTVPAPSFGLGPTVAVPLDSNLVVPSAKGGHSKGIDEGLKVQEVMIPLSSLPPPVQTPNQNPSKKKVSLQTLPEEIRTPSNDVLQPYVESHCLIISGSNIGRFLPPRHNPDPILSMRVVPIPERKYHVILEFEESPEPPKPKPSNSGLIVAEPEEDLDAGCRYQRESFAWIKDSRVATTGMLLRNVERITEFPYVTYLVVGGGRHELSQKLIHVRDRPIPIQQQQLHFLAGYEETVTVSRPPPSTFPEHPVSDRSGFVISLYQVLPGDDGLRFEQNWVMWTGARQLYRKVPEHMGLKRISIHKSFLPTQVINYSLICEFTNIMDYLTDACVIIDHLRARCCGFVGIYRILDSL